MVENNLSKSDKDYLIIGSVSLEAPNALKTLKKLAQNPNVRGVR